MPFRKVLCPVDFSDSSRAALETAVQLTRDLGAQLVIAHVWEVPLRAVYAELLREAEPLAPIVAREEEQLAQLAREAAQLGAKAVETKMLFGVAWDAIAQETRSGAGYDLVVVGTHGRTGIKDALIGSTAERVARHAGCPVLLVRAKASP